MRIDGARRIAGTLTPPPDKSISHRAALVAAMSDGPVRIRNYLRARDTAATIAAVSKLGAQVAEQEPRGAGIDLVVRGVGLRGARAIGGPLDIGNAGTLMRLLPGWLAGQQGGRWTLDGDQSIRRRPVDRIARPLRLMGAKVECREGRLPPLEVEGAALAGIDYEPPVASAQVKSCLLLAALLADGETTVAEPLPTRDHTEILLRGAGAPIRREAAAVTVGAAERLALDEVAVPGDFSSAAFFIVAATLAAGSELLVERVGVNPTRTGLLDVLKRMGGDVRVEDRRSVDGEPLADLLVRHAELEATVVGRAEVPLLIDELPLVALLGAFAGGTTVVRGAAELRRKESDRIAAVTDGLRALGAEIEATSDGFVVEGRGGLRGGTIGAGGDHRIAMLGAVAGVASREGVEVRDFESAAVSYPGFATDLQRVSQARPVGR